MPAGVTSHTRATLFNAVLVLYYAVPISGHALSRPYDGVMELGGEEGSVFLDPGARYAPVTFSKPLGISVRSIAGCDGNSGRLMRVMSMVCLSAMWVLSYWFGLLRPSW